MNIEKWESAGPLAELYIELKALGLETNIAELEAFGFTVVPPEKVGPKAFLVEAREALERTLISLWGADALAPGRWDNINETHRFLLWEDPIYQKLSLNPAGLGLAQYLLGTDCTLSLCNAWVKGPGEMRTSIHGDYLDGSAEARLSFVNVNCNMHYVLSDYTKEDGALSMVPGSHRWRRQPTPPEIEYWADRAHPVEAAAGSIIVWGNHTWHGSYPKKTPGLRLTLQCEYVRRRFQPEEAYRETVTQEALDRNPIRFAGLVDAYNHYPFGKCDQDIERVLSAPSGTGPWHAGAGYRSLFDDEPANGRTTVRPDYDYNRHDGLYHAERRRMMLERVKALRKKSAPEEEK